MTHSNLYSINIYNHTGSLVTNLKQWDRAEFVQRVSLPWSHSIQIRTKRDSEYAELLRNLVRDYFVVITKIDPEDLQQYIVYEGLHNTVTEQMQVSGDLFFNIYGAGYSKLLDRRLVVPPAGVEYNEKTGLAEDLIKAYVLESCVNTTDLNRIMPGFTVAASSGRGNTVEYSARYTNLQSVVEALADDGDLDFGVTGNGELGTFLFDARPLWGIDRTAASDKPVIFSLEHGNIDIPILSTNARHEKNFVFVGGAGRGVDRVIFQFEDTEAIETSPWGRSELFEDGRKEINEVALRSLANRVLRERGKQVSIDFDAIQTSAIRWPRDYGIGDLATAKYGGIELDIKINKITVTLTAGTAAQTPETIALELI